MNKYVERALPVLDRLVLEGAKSNGLWILICLACVAVASLLRLLVQPFLGADVPYITFFPAVMIAAFLGGMRSAILSLVLSGVLTWLWILAPAGVTSNERAAFLLFLVLGGMIAFVAVALRTAILSLRASNASLNALLEHKTLMSQELRHRIKNVLTIVQALSAQARRQATSIEDYASRLDGRILALAAAHDVFGGSEDDSAELEDLVKKALRPFSEDMPEQCVILAGPHVRLRGASIVNVTLSLHELATNATKYGALNGGDGQVEIGWTYEPASRRLELSWNEKGLAGIVAPTKPGFGSFLIKQMFANEEDNAVALTFADDGLKCRASCALSA